MGSRWTNAVAAAVAVVLATGVAPARAAEPATVRVSVAADSSQANGPSRPELPLLPPLLSHDGRYVAFPSEATNLAPNNGQVRKRIYRKDLKSGSVVQVDTAINGDDRRDVDSHLLDMSDDGRFVLYSIRDLRSATPKRWLLRDLKTATTRHMIARTVALSDDGRRALVAGPQARIVDLRTGRSTSLPGEGIALNGDGSVVLIKTPEDLLPDDTDAFDDLYVIDTKTSLVTRVPPSIDGWSWRWCASHPFALVGRAPYVTFATCVPDHFRGAVFDPRTPVATLVPIIDGHDNAFPAVSDDGRLVSFTSYTENTSVLRTDLMQWDRQANTVRAVASTFDGSPAHTAPGMTTISAVSSYSDDGRYVAYFSSVDNLVPGDTNAQFDVFRTRAK